jgi:hypothetical protein
VTNSNKPKRPARRNDASRQPPTIDLKATVVEETPEPKAETVPAGDSEPVRADSLPESATPTAAPAGAEAETPPSELPPAEPPPAEPLPPEAGIGPGAAEPHATAIPEEPAAAAEERAAAPPPPPVREERRSAGFGSLLAAGLVGGLVGAGAVVAYQSTQGPASTADPRVAQLQEQVAGLSRAPDLRPVESRLAALDTAQKDLAQRLEAVQQTAQQAAVRAEEALARPAPDGGAAPAPSPQVAENAEAVAQLRERLSGIEAQLQQQGQAASGEAEAFRQQIAQRIDALDRQLGETAESLRRAAEEQAQAVGSRVAESTETLRNQVSELDRRLAGLSEQVASGGSEATRAGTRVVLADRLNGALAQGTPFAEVLGALRDYGVDAARLAALEPYAQEGAPTPAELARSFAPLAERIVDESRSGDTWSDKLLRMADKVVTVRPVNDTGGGDVPSVVARIENALSQGRLEDAAAAWDSLPEPARRLSEDWGRQLKQRAAAEDSARAIAADAVSALNPATR